MSKVTDRKYRLFPHTADLGVIIYGSSPAELFAHAAFAVYDLMTDISRVSPVQEITLRIEGDGREELLVNCLREVLYLFHGRQFLGSDFRILTLTETEVSLAIRGETLDPSRHRLRRELKAVTYCELAIRQTPGGWEATVVFDV